MLDSRKTLRQFTTKVVQGSPPLEWQIGEGPLFADLKVDTVGLIEQILDPKDRSRAESSPWLGLNPMAPAFFRAHLYSYGNPNLMQMRVYPSLPGREILELYYNSIVDANKGDAESTLRAYESLDGVYPDVDPSNEYRFAQRAINLLWLKKPKEALTVANAVLNSIPLEG